MVTSETQGLPPLAKIDHHSDDGLVKAEVEAALQKKKRRKWTSARRQTEAASSSPIPLIKQVDRVEWDSSARDEADIELTVDYSAIQAQEDANVYQWVVVTENQRGFMLFSSPHYSCASLLPNDPPPFLLQDNKTSHGVISGLDEYTLPSPMWLWVSRFWMVDMCGEGDVDSRGWEYNWSFKQTGWRSQVKSLSRGGWVRRRRWVRLMMKPSGRLPGNVRGGQEDEVKPLDSDCKASDTWRGDSGDWERCRRASKLRGWDGPKLELWKIWAEEQHERKNMRPLRIALQSHGQEILYSFIYPESRLEFVKLLKLWQLDTDLDPTLLTTTEREFWSFVDR